MPRMGMRSIIERYYSQGVLPPGQNSSAEYVLDSHLDILKDLAHNACCGLFCRGCSKL